MGSEVTFDDDRDSGTLAVVINGQTALVYQYGSDLDMAHYYPVNSPSGKTMTIQQTEPYPHHRSFWFADKVQLTGQRAVTFYDALYSSQDKQKRTPPYTDHIRHVGFSTAPGAGDRPALRARLLWEMDTDQPVLDEDRVVHFTGLGHGEYFLDMTFTLTATYGDVAFRSDWVHYAWPYVRMHPRFSVDGGGTITSSEGGRQQAGTNGKVATWMDYSSTIDGTTEGLAIFSHSSNGHPHKWLTRDYGTFGPRRIDARSGTAFTLKKDDSITQRVGVLVHRGGVTDGDVARRYQQYVSGQAVH